MIPSDIQIADARFLVADTETTGNQAAVDQPCQIATALVQMGHGTLFVSGNYLVKPTIPISYGAMAVHHIMDADVADAPDAITVLRLIGKAMIDATGLKPDAYVAHNSPFDSAILPQLNKVPWLDTLRMSKKLYPELPSHTNQFLRYALSLPVPRENRGHDAANDVETTSALLLHMLEELTGRPDGPKTLWDLLEWVSAPVLVAKCMMPKHKDKTWAEVVKEDPDYCVWVLGGDFKDLDSDVRHTIIHFRDMVWPNGWPAKKGKARR